MTRRESRESAFQVIFGMSTNAITADEAIEYALECECVELDEFSKNLIRTTFNYIYDIDEMLKPHLKGWSIKRISKASLAILRISCAQLFYWNEIDKNYMERLERIVINESVEIAKKYASDDDYQFINGVLGSIVRGENNN